MPKRGLMLLLARVTKASLQMLPLKWKHWVARQLWFQLTCLMATRFERRWMAPHLLLGGLDIVVNNAGGNSFSVPLANMRMSGWQKTFGLNVESVVHVCQAAAPYLMASGNASVINLSSVAAVGGAPFMSHYGAAKAAICSLTKSLAIEWAYAGVRVNTLLPGWIETDLTDFLRVDSETEKGALARVPMQRWGRVEDIAQPAVFLASDASAFMTGQELVVDGGLTVMP